MVKVVGKIGPKEAQARALREAKASDLDIPPFLRRPAPTPAQEAALAKKASTPSIITLAAPLAARSGKDDPKTPQTQEATVQTKRKQTTPAKKPVAKPAAKKSPAKSAAKQNARTPVGLRKDGLREGSGMATLVDTVCRKGGATNEQLCKAVGWKQCLPMLKKACERAGVKLRTEKKDGEPTRYIGTR